MAGPSRATPVSLDESSDDDGSRRDRRNQAPSVGGDGRRRQRARETNNDLLSHLTEMRQEDANHRTQQNQMWERYLNICERQTRNREEETRYFRQWMQRQDALNDELSGHMLRIVMIMHEAVNQEPAQPVCHPPCTECTRFPGPSATPSPYQPRDGHIQFAGTDGAFRPPQGVVRPTPLHATYRPQPHGDAGLGQPPSPSWSIRHEETGRQHPRGPDGQGFIRERHHHTGGDVDESMGPGQAYAGVGVGRILHHRDSDEESTTF